MALPDVLAEARDLLKRAASLKESWILVSIPAQLVAAFTIIAFAFAVINYRKIKKAKPKSNDDPSNQTFWKLYRNSQILNVLLIILLVCCASVAMVLTVKFREGTNGGDVKGLMWVVYIGIILVWALQCWSIISSPRLLQCLIAPKADEPSS
ncbi:hypothetical protein NW762_005859 [Fusarium torreyae]|uniref:Uncharacterized protein n=1 Tax=Fusarium torreyae TaxID=1237075 RepID=A0A9W8VFR7_9HYPO|nr:hypothetical protein NW762_005859 [Fusarium torreyae]